MLRIKIPVSLPNPSKGGDLRITCTIGDLGFTYSTILKRGKWTNGGIMYIEEETNEASFEITGRPNSKLLVKIKNLLEPPEKFSRNDGKSANSVKKRKTLTKI